MPYGQYGGPHYGRGDYYQGDLISSIGKKLVKVGKQEIGKLTKKYLGGGAGGTTVGPPIIPTRTGGFYPAGTNGGPQIPVPGAKGKIQRFLPGGESGYLTPTYGYHANKAYMRYLRAMEQGRDVEDPTQEPRVTNLLVRNRAMNPANPRALRRAVRRQQSFIALARRVMRGTGMSIKRSGFGRSKARGRAVGKR